jgi:hypothetical protein
LGSTNCKLWHCHGFCRLQPTVPQCAREQLTTPGSRALRSVVSTWGTGQAEDLSSESRVRCGPLFAGSRAPCPTRDTLSQAVALFQGMVAVAWLATPWG